MKYTEQDVEQLVDQVFQANQKADDMLVTIPQLADATTIAMKIKRTIVNNRQERKELDALKRGTKVTSNDFNI